jgi:hypothetical protein
VAAERRRSVRLDVESRVPDVDDVPVSRRRVFVAGLVSAAAVMLVAEMFVVLVLRAPEILLIGAPLTIAFVITAGIPITLAMHRLTRGIDLRIASLLFGMAGLVAGGLWGYPVFTLALNTAGDAAGVERGPAAAALVGAMYAGSLAALGAIVGRYFGPWIATRPGLVRSALWCIAMTGVIGVVVLSFVQL